MSVELIRPASDWRRDPKEIARLGRFLEEQGHFRTPEERWYFVEKIDREGWSAHYEDMLSEQREQERERLYEEERAMESERRYMP